MMLGIVLLLQVAVAPPPGQGSPLVHSNGKVPRAVRAVRTEQPPHIDGRLDDPIWATITPETGFRRDVPSDGNPATEATEVRIAYDKDALYVGARLYDRRPDLVSHRLNRRDSFAAFNDVFFVLIDSYHDHRTQFILGVTAAGERRDAIATNDGNGNYDAGWDPVWEAKTSIDSLGWVAEMRIPFSQLRFAGATEQVWGIQLRRDNVRAGEAVDWQWSPRQDPGLVSKYGHLVGLSGIPAPKRLEFLPYTSSQATFTQGVPAGNPFDDGSKGSITGGIDAKYGITSDLTLNATINPDFGQVEADPSVVNLTAFETFFEERRPFFVEGSNLFEFRAGLDLERLFYSRRIGRAPGQSAVGTADWVDEPASASILGALKLSGRTRSGWSIGAIDALTQREYARTLTGNGPIQRVAVEPLANYGVLRLKKDLNNGSSGFGFMSTAVNRDASAADFPSINKSAYVGAADFFHRWDKNRYQFSGFLAGSRIDGPAQAIQLAQMASSRYFQRPDQDYATPDPAATHMAGSAGQLVFDKLGGDWTYSLAGNYTSPGFEINDAGFQQGADRIRIASLATRRWVSPGKLGRSGSLSFQANQQYNFGGTRLAPKVGFGAVLQRHNFSSIFFNAGYRFRAFDDRITRGGPLVRAPGSAELSVHFLTDGRKPLSVTVGGDFNFDADGSTSHFAFVQLNGQNNGRLTFQLTPSVERGRSKSFYVTTYADGTATGTFGGRYIFAPLSKDVLGISARLNYYFSPALSLQFYAQPFVARADYGVPLWLEQAGGYAFTQFGTRGSTYSADTKTNTITVNPNGNAPAGAHTLANPDFSIRSIRSNLVLRWEYRPGSTLFLVWNQNRFNFRTDPRFRAFQNLGGIFSDDMQNTLLVKANYYFSF